MSANVAAVLICDAAGARAVEFFHPKRSKKLKYKTLSEIRNFLYVHNQCIHRIDYS